MELLSLLHELLLTDPELFRDPSSLNVLRLVVPLFGSMGNELRLSLAESGRTSPNA